MYDHPLVIICMGDDDDDFVLLSPNNDADCVGDVVGIAVVLFSLPTFIIPNSFSILRIILHVASTTFFSNSSCRLRYRIRRSVVALANAASRRALLDVSRAVRDARLLANAVC